MSKSEVKPNPILEEIKSLTIIVLIALTIRALILEPYYIPSGSMKDTLLEGDYVFATKFDYGYSKHSFPFSPDIFSGRIFEKKPARGDIIIFRPPHLPDWRYIKRLIGLPGDKIELKRGIVFINDKMVERNFVGKYIDDNGVSYNKYQENLPNGVKYYVLDLFDNTLTDDAGEFDNAGPYFVPEGAYFFMGDNRDQSGDSRSLMGTVPAENLIAKARFIAFSFGQTLWLEDATVVEQIQQIWHWITSLRFARMPKNVYSAD